MKKTFIAMTACLLCTTVARTQGTAEDYNRAYSLRTKYNAARVTHSDVQPQWIPGTDCFWYIRHTTEQDEYVRVEAGRNRITPLFDTRRLAEALTKLSGREAKADRLPIRNVQAG